MPDLVLPVTQRRWKDLVRNGGPYGPNSGSRDITFFLGYAERPRVQQGSRLYLVAGQRIRGWTTIRYLESEPPGYQVIARGMLSGTTLYDRDGDDAKPLRVPHIKGYTYRWWEPDLELPWDQWREAALA